MEREQIQTMTELFEGHAQQTENGVEYWLARDLQVLLGYTEWRNFMKIIEKAETACDVSGHRVSDHFVDVNKMIDLGSGSQREIYDIINFALIRSKGDQALFGKSTQVMKAQWRVPDSRPLADFAPTIILKAKDFAAEITIHNAREHQMQSEAQISSEHVTNNQAVRDTLLSRGIRPESLPPAEDVKKVEHRLTSEKKKALKNPDRLEKE